MDRADVQRLVSGVLSEFGLKFDPPGTDSDLRDIQAIYIEPGGMFDLLVDGSGQVVGSVGLCPVSDSVCELRKMYLIPGARGCGQGKRILEHALRRASELGFRRVVLETAFVLESAIALYERHGFRRYIPAHLSERCDAAYSLDLPPDKQGRSL